MKRHRSPDREDGRANKKSSSENEDPKVRRIRTTYDSDRDESIRQLVLAESGRSVEFVTSKILRTGTLEDLKRIMNGLEDEDEDLEPLDKREELMCDLISGKYYLVLEYNGSKSAKCRMESDSAAGHDQLFSRERIHGSYRINLQAKEPSREHWSSSLAVPNNRYFHVSCLERVLGSEALGKWLEPETKGFHPLIIDWIEHDGRSLPAISLLDVLLTALGGDHLVRNAPQDMKIAIVDYVGNIPDNLTKKSLAASRLVKKQAAQKEMEKDDPPSAVTDDPPEDDPASVATEGDSIEQEQSSQ